MTCQRRGYQCACADCQHWIEKWSRELDAWTLIDEMMKSGRSLYSIYERLQCDYPEMLMHCRKIESKFVERAIERVDILSNSKDEGKITDEPRRRL